jgi:putative ABC transport system permease protein
MWQDVRYSLRTIRKQPLFTLLAAAVLALGVGLNTAVFSVVSALFFRPLPIHEPGRVVFLYQTLPAMSDRPSLIHTPLFDHFREHNQSFTGISGSWAMPLRITYAGETEVADGEGVQVDYFEVLGIPPALGRPLTAADATPDATENPIVISHDLWTRRLGANADVLGTEIRVAGHYGEAPFRVVGVMPPGFKGIAEDPWTPSQFWIPARLSDPSRPRTTGFAFIGIARLAPGVSLAQARAVIHAQGQQLAEQTRRRAPEPGREPRSLVLPASDVRMPYWPDRSLIPTRLAAALGIVVLMVLLVAVSNIAGILMARGVGRTSEIAVRRVLGAGGLRIVRQLMTESVILAACGGVAGLLLAHWLLAVHHALTPLNYAIDAPIDWRVVTFSVVTCAVCGLLVGLAPALQAARLDVLPALGNSGNTSTRKTKRRLRHAIVLPQVALSLMLLLVAGVYVRALMQVELASPGYDPSNVAIVNGTLRALPGDRPGMRGAEAEARARRLQQYYQQLLSRLQASPGMTAAIASSLPLHAVPEQVAWVVSAAEHFDPAAPAGPPAMRASVSPGYFAALDMRVLSGRDFDARDTRATPRAGIISAALAAKLWPGRDAVGRTAVLVSTWPGSTPEPFEVVGVVNDVQPVLQDAGQSPLVYFAMGQQWQPQINHIVARSRDPQHAIQQVRAAVTGADPLAEVYRARMLTQLAAEILYPRRLAAGVLLGSGLIALLLASVGIYGVMSYSVAQRLGEIGVRRALGAESRDIAALVLGEGLKVAAVGSVAGVVFGYIAIRFTSNRVLALPQLDALTIIAVPILMAVVVVAACWMPARRAARVDPMEVLRRV